MNDLIAMPEFQDVIGEIARVAEYLWQRGWAEVNSGNISVDITELVPWTTRESSPLVPMKISQLGLAGRSFLIKIGGARMRDLARQPEKHLLLITIEKNLEGYFILWGGDHVSRPTSEFMSHLKVHQLLRENGMPQKVFLHTHTPHLLALSYIDKYCSENKLNQLLFMMHPEVRVYVPDGIGVASYRCPGSEELADVTVEALKKHRVVLWEKHGCAAIARNPYEAFDLIDILDKAASTYIMCRSLGREPSGLSQEQLKEIDRLFCRK